MLREKLKYIPYWNVKCSWQNKSEEVWFVCQEEQIIFMHQAKKNKKTYLNRLLKLLKLGSELSSASLKTGRTVGNCDLWRRVAVGKEILNDSDPQSLICLVKSNFKKAKVELTAVFTGENKSISTCTGRRELKGLRLNSCVALKEKHL